MKEGGKMEMEKLDDERGDERDEGGDEVVTVTREVMRW